MLREKTSLIEQLNEKLNDNQRILLQHQSNSQALEIAKVKNSLQASEIRCERLGNFYVKNLKPLNQPPIHGNQELN